MRSIDNVSPAAGVVESGVALVNCPAAIQNTVLRSVNGHHINKF